MKSLISRIYLKYYYFVTSTNLLIIYYTIKVGLFNREIKTK